MFSLIIRPEVYTELQQAKEWCNEQQRGLGQEFKLATNNKIEHIAKRPYHFQVKWRMIRAAFLK